MLLNLSVKGDNSLILLITLEIIKWEPTNEIKFFMTVNTMIQQQRECYLRITCILFEDLVQDFTVANAVLLGNTFKN
jgi:hypothetical protein